ncbi:MAG: ATP-dependent Clp protease proteolytic subunit [Leptospiraceae bacterium]|jgi:ATP-dependent Clp protease protease subunit|nr:ATP-dependent Clp protease proteolytic subunit [Leptospiraceae bacterium]MBK7055638.1 ATP-dependent Clp protease proteolytic subunit [Leptospiraceae bacterium]MBK9502222.1 ATP-dependent Clp protease proteolytic subunit [Leptospiraceae bacterium]MBP9164136.1 ATP-dependent Clp protease proteolytic subunit [Leptospiraceae bacterium]HRG46669.1 ATP-dependent Clp protease proteolytic subunit [Leptospiraceae bacterium]
MPIVPYITEQTSRGERSSDVFSRLLKDRVIFIGSGIDDEFANILTAQLLFLEADNPERDIYLYINSPGGYISSGLAVYDTIQYIKPEVRTLCFGQASSMASLLLAAGAKGKRSALPHARIMMHQPSGGATGQASDIEIQANEILRVKSIINSLYQKHTEKDIQTIERDTERDFYMTAEEAKAYGIIDNVITDRKKPKVG